MDMLTFSMLQTGTSKEAHAQAHTYTHFHIHTDVKRACSSPFPGSPSEAGHKAPETHTHPSCAVGWPTLRRPTADDLAFDMPSLHLPIEDNRRDLQHTNKAVHHSRSGSQT